LAHSSSSIGQMSATLGQSSTWICGDGAGPGADVSFACGADVTVDVGADVACTDVVPNIDEVGSGG
jgi:hypothetical protein